MLMSVINNSMRKALTLSLLAAAVTAVATEPADSIAGRQHRRHREGDVEEARRGHGRRQNTLA